MKTFTFHGIKLEDVLIRLAENESQVFATASSTSEGWGNLIAWNPIAVFKPQSSDANEIVKELEYFANTQQVKDCLVAGYETYDFGCLLHDVKLAHSTETNVPNVVGLGFDNWITFNSSDAVAHYSDPNFKIQVKAILQRPKRPLSSKFYDKPLSPLKSRDWYSDAYKRIKQYIKDGDVYQVNLTHRLIGLSKSSGRNLFCVLHQVSKVDFQSYIEVEGFEIISFSPERFIKVEDRLIESSPIKGTRERGLTIAQDEKLRKDLESNPKELAELNMITDLLRNDLGKICKVGTVEVAQQRQLRAYPTLWHAHSTIQGQLEDNISPIAALSSLMPGGSITGCPKKRAIEIINELEPVRRGIYTGSIFVICPDGKLDSSIAIRTMVKNDEQIHLSVGGGIVNDSIEDDEYQESIDKALSFINVDTRYEQKTSSDILESQFGKTDIEIIHQDFSLRVICTKATQSGKVLEYSIVEFVKDGIDAFPEIHREVLSGQSMGKAFTNAGIEFTRNIHDMYKFILPDKVQKNYKSSLPSNVVDVIIELGPDKIPYARILETFSPDVIFADCDGKPTYEQSKMIDKLSNFIR